MSTISETLERLQFNKEHAREVLTDSNEIQNLLGDELFVLVESELQGKTYYDLFVEVVDELIEEKWNWRDPVGIKAYVAKDNKAIKDNRDDIRATSFKQGEEEGLKKGEKSGFKKGTDAGVAGTIVVGTALYAAYKLYKHLKASYVIAKTPEAKAKIKDKMDRAQAKIKTLKAKKRK